ncbi:MAG: hypothetical protein H0U51_00835 [Propionibacteriales bacterium]|nr:hypothetical protein [Propionibacteriales bacterium]
MTDRPRTPPNLSAPGRSLWQAITSRYVLRRDELLLLEKAARTADEAARLDAAVRTAPLIVAGSMGQERANPLLAEARQGRALLAALLKQLALPDSGEDAGAKQRDTSARATTAARARWGERSGSSG